MEFKANHGGVMAGRNVYLRNRRNQIARQPTEIMISLAISLGDIWFLLVIGYIRNLVVRHLDSGHDCRRRSGWNVALHPGVTLIVTGGRLDGDGRILISFTSHGEREAGAAQRAVNVK
jgi:hypothetical protein